MTFEIPGDETPRTRSTPALATVAKLDNQQAGFRIEEFGDASADKALSQAFEDDFQKAEVTSLPITLIILILAFGALLAAFVPLLLAITAVAAAISLIGPISQIWPVDEAISSVVLLIGLAVGVDYSMFYLRREREERAAGRSEEAALQAAAATSGRAVLVSGITVIAAMAGMYFGGAPTFVSFATGTILVVAIAVIGSLTVLPAVLSKLGDRVNKGRVPFLKPEKRTGEPRVWSWVLDRVLKRPLVSLLAAGCCARGARDPRVPHPHGGLGRRRAAALDRDHADLRPDAGRLPGRAVHGRHRGRGREPRPVPDPGGRGGYASDRA